MTIFIKQVDIAFVNFTDLVVSQSQFVEKDMCLVSVREIKDSSKYSPYYKELGL